MMSGALARTAPSRRATRNSFWMSISRRRPASSRVPSMVARPRTKPASMRRSMSATLPPSRRAAPTVAMTSATGSASASRMARPMRPASVTVPGTVAPRAWATVMGYSALAAMPPQAMAMARSRRSAQAPSALRKVARWPRSSTTTAGPAGMPARCIVTCWTSGNARPMPSASSTGRRMRAAHVKGTMPLEPPISAHMRALTGAPLKRSTSSRRYSPSAPDESFSMVTVGAPRKPQDMTTLSAGRSSKVTSSTGP